MARPTKPKDLKPKTEGELSAVPAAPAAGGGAGLDIKLLVSLAIVALISVLGTAGSTYLLGTMIIVPEIQKVAVSGGGAHGEEAGEHGAPAHVSQVGMNLELDEFMVNLKPDPTMGGNQYLRAKMALSIQVPAEEDCYALDAHAMVPVQIATIAGGKIAGAAAPVTTIDRTTIASGGGAPDPKIVCQETFKANMSRYVPTIRDVINASLMKRTAGVLATLEGQEDLKDDIKGELTALMAPNYSVIRVNFEDFIIQR